MSSVPRLPFLFVFPAAVGGSSCLLFLDCLVCVCVCVCLCVCVSCSGWWQFLSSVPGLPLVLCVCACVRLCVCVFPQRLVAVHKDELIAGDRVRFISFFIGMLHRHYHYNLW